jgi:hypothetical protein
MPLVFRKVKKAVIVLGTSFALILSVSFSWKTGNYLHRAGITDVPKCGKGTRKMRRSESESGVGERERERESES